ncbi:hypothetical protein [uncultured Propionibacterium sp.]|uniref:hypothetical protein n=1 Tax=uncultured Propionibacterium sp. TaxID=218066 RepID=UPI00292F0F0D|nr:hypothetical protein [uncultured Propionibacterium sp.]
MTVVRASTWTVGAGGAPTGAPSGGVVADPCATCGRFWVCRRRHEELGRSPG